MNSLRIAKCHEHLSVFWERAGEPNNHKAHLLMAHEAYLIALKYAKSLNPPDPDLLDAIHSSAMFWKVRLRKNPTQFLAGATRSAKDYRDSLEGRLDPADERLFDWYFWELSTLSRTLAALSLSH